MLLSHDFKVNGPFDLSFPLVQRFISETNLISYFNIEDGEINRIRDWLELSDQNKVIKIDTFDPPPFENLQEIVAQYPNRLKIIGAGDYCYWIICCGFYFKTYTVNEVFPVSFDYNYLCYQRKMNEHRIVLYDALKDVSKGIITRGDQQYDFNQNQLHNQHSLITFVTNDILSLGNMDIWNRSFLNIVSETGQSYFNPVFLSEKTFKPIIGMRPFLSYGHYQIGEKLKSLGFETFDEDFGYSPSINDHENAGQLRDILSQLDNLDKLYDKLYPKILHNKNHFKTAYRNELDRLDDLVDQCRNW